MQPTLDTGFFRSARFGGVLRYHYKTLGKTVLLILAILLGSEVLSLVFPLVTGNPYPYMGVAADLSVTMLVTLVCACVVAGRSTRFLLRFGTSRLSVWMGNLIGLWAGMAALLLGTLLLSLLLGGLVLLLSSTLPQSFAVQSLFSDLDSAALFRRTFSEALAALPQSLLYLVEWAAIFYFFGTCLRRKPGLTLTVVIGVPLLVLMLTLFPAVRQAADMAQHANDQQIMLLGVRWMKYAMDVINFVEHQWPAIQLVTAVVSLPLSYLCMRGTPQP